MSGPIYLKIPGTDLYCHEGDCVNGRFVRPTRPSGLKTHAQWLAAPAPAPVVRPTPAPAATALADFVQDLPHLVAQRYAQRQAAREQPPAAPDTTRLIVAQMQGDSRVNRPSGTPVAVPVPRPAPAAPRVATDQLTVPEPPDTTKLIIEKQRGDHRINGGTR